MTADEYDESFAAVPEPRRDRRRQGAAVGGARRRCRRYDLPRVAVDLAGEEGGGGLRPGPRPTRSCSAATRPGCSSCSGSATRRTASRSASTGSAARRGRAGRSSTTCRASARRGAARCCSHFGSAERLLEATQEELEGVPGVPAKTARADLRAAAQGGPGMRRAATLALVLVLALAGCGGGESGAADDGRDREARRPRPPPGDPGKDAIDAFVAAAAAGKTRRDLGDALEAVEAAPRADARRVQERRRAASSRTQLGAFARRTR